MVEDLFDAFAGAVVSISFDEGPMTLHTDPSGAVGRAYPFVGPVHIVTAYNPRGVPSDAIANAARHRELIELAKGAGLTYIETVGSGPDGWLPEPGLLLVDAGSRRAADLGLRFRQSAIYEWSRDQLLILGVADDGFRDLGWRLVPGAVAVAP